MGTYPIEVDEAVDVPSAAPGQPEKFFFTMIEGKQFNSASGRLRTRELANEEAARLAARHQCRVFVLEAVAACRPVQNVTWTSF